MSVVRYSCPCGTSLQLPGHQIGQPFFCPSCGVRTVLGIASPLAADPIPAPEPVVVEAPAAAPAAQAEPTRFAVEPAPRPIDFGERLAIDRMHRRRTLMQLLWGGSAVACVIALVCAVVIVTRHQDKPESRSQRVAEPSARQVGRNEPPATRPAPIPVPTAPRVPPGPRLAEATKESAAIAPVTVSVTRWQVDRPMLFALGERTLAREQFLVLDLRITNADPGRRLEYRTWQRPAADGAPAARAVDEWGNEYRPTEFETGTTVADQARSAPLYAGGPVADRVVFPRPVPAALQLGVLLPGDNVGLPGQEFRFRIRLVQ